MLEEYRRHERVFQSEWLPAPFVPPREQTIQSSGLCFSSGGKVTMVSQGKGWVLPGGYPEPGESLDDALIREIAEEACATVLDHKYLGCIRTYELSPITAGNLPIFYQARYWVRVELGPFIPHFEMTERIEVEPKELVDLLRWNAKQTARDILNDALAWELAKRSNPASEGTLRGVEGLDTLPPAADLAK